MHFALLNTRPRVIHSRVHHTRHNQLQCIELVDNLYIIWDVAATRIPWWEGSYNRSRGGWCVLLNEVPFTQFHSLPMLGDEAALESRRGGAIEQSRIRRKLCVLRFTGCQLDIIY